MSYIENPYTVWEIADRAITAKAWPFEEARKVLKRIQGKTPKKGFVLFETGYGPSGLPHIGTFGEIARTTMVIQAFRQLTENKIPTKLLCFSDDMDGFRKVPTNVPNQHMLIQDLHKSLTKVRDPFGVCGSFGEYNNQQLQKFLDAFGFEYEFASSTEYYTSGRFDTALLKLLQYYEKIQAIMLPTLGEERRSTYSPFMPICPDTDHVLQVPVIAIDVENGTLTYRRADGAEITTLVTGGACKLQWKPDFAMRWYALDVDYEMCGKDLKPTIDISSRITRTLGGTPPENLIYELFLDEHGMKISKSKGNGLTIEQWLKYAPQESLSLFMYQKPKTAKKLYFGVIPKAMDEYLTWVEKYPHQDLKARFDNPVHHIHAGQVPHNQSPISFALLLNLVSVANTEDKSVVWSFITRYVPDASAEKNPKLDDMITYALNYYRDFVKSEKVYRPMTDAERPQFIRFKESIHTLRNCNDPAELQTAVFDVAREFKYENKRDWFTAIYNVLFGAQQGPRMGSFILLFGIDETIALIDKALAGELK